MSEIAESIIKRAMARQVFFSVHPECADQVGDRRHNEELVILSKRITELEAALERVRGAVIPHIADLRKTADVLERDLGKPFDPAIKELRLAAKDVDKS